MIVAVLALDQVMGFELMIPGQVFGMANLAAAEPGAMAADAPGVPRYEIRVCGARIGSGGSQAGAHWSRFNPPPITASESHRCVSARSRWLPPDCWTADGPPHIGGLPGD